jgi:hypothetical protein
MIMGLISFETLFQTILITNFFAIAKGWGIVRYYILSRKLDLKTVNTGVILNLVLISSLLSLFWSLAPLLGWSSYTLEEGLVSCSAKYNEQSWNVISYNMAMLLFVFFVPFLLTVILNVKSILNVSYYFIIIIIIRINISIWVKIFHFYQLVVPVHTDHNLKLAFFKRTQNYGSIL